MKKVGLKRQLHTTPNYSCKAFQLPLTSYMYVGYHVLLWSLIFFYVSLQTGSQVEGDERNKVYGVPHLFLLKATLGIDFLFCSALVGTHFQCFPYQAVTGKIYHLKQHFLLPATAWRFIKNILKKESCDLIGFSQRKWINIYGKVLKYTQLFFLWAMHFGKRSLKTE